jgi:hypothetical protein
MGTTGCRVAPTSNRETASRLVTAADQACWSCAVVWRTVSFSPSAAICVYNAECEPLIEETPMR